MSLGAPFILYGATGYAGRMVAEQACARGLRPILAGRTRVQLERVATELGCEYAVAPLDDAAAVTSLLARAPIVLNAAGPFAATAGPLASRAIGQGVHYLDLSGEVDAFESVAKLHEVARRQNVMLMPGVGFDVVPSDCLAVHTARSVREPRRLSLAIFGMGPPSRGSARTMVRELGRPIRVRRRGTLSSVPAGEGERRFRVDGMELAGLPVSWGDLVTAYYSTGVPDITVYFEATPSLRFALAASRSAQYWRDRRFAADVANVLAEMVNGEPPAHATEVTILAEVEGAGVRRRALLRTPGVYEVTTQAAFAVIERVLRAQAEPGFQTPGRLFGPDFVLSLPRVTRSDLTS
jgi:short subunit dehydrogenase-like uncharacterized protein